MKKTKSYFTIVNKFKGSQVQKVLSLLAIGLVLLSAFLFYSSWLNKESSQIGFMNIWSAENMSVSLSKMYYYFFPNKFKKDFYTADFGSNITSEQEFTFWLRVAGIESVLNKTQDDLLKHDNLTTCHSVYHRIGQISYRVYGDKAFSFFDQDCSAGYTHGMIYEYSINHNSDDLVNNLEYICSRVSSNTYKLECFHGIGHGVLLHENYDLSRAIEGCKNLSTQPIRNLCYSGAFMENLMAAEGLGANHKHEANHGIPSSEWASGDPLAPCNRLVPDSNVQSVCDTYIAGRILDLYKGDFKQVVNLCRNALSVFDRRLCFVGLGQEAAFRNKGNSSRIISVCSLTDEYFQSCIDGAIRHFVYFYADDLGDRAVELCKRIVLSKDKIFCYKLLGTKLNEVFYKIKTKTEIESKCQNAEDDYKETCLNGTMIEPQLF